MPARRAPAGSEHHGLPEVDFRKVLAGAVAAPDLGVAWVGRPKGMTVTAGRVVLVRLLAGSACAMAQGAARDA